MGYIDYEYDPKSGCYYDPRSNFQDISQGPGKNNKVIINSIREITNIFKSKNTGIIIDITKASKTKKGRKEIVDSACAGAFLASCIAFPPAAVGLGVFKIFQQIHKGRKNKL